MTKHDQKAFVKEVMNNAENSLVFLIAKGVVPERWTGKELRLWIADYIKGNYAYYKMTRKEIREYNNDLQVIGNLI